MRVLVTGAHGLLGSEVCDCLVARGHEPVPKGRELDISDPESVAQIAVESFGKLDWVVNCAAYTAVDLAETEEQKAYETNGLGPAYLSSVCNMAGVKILHVSTDFVFDGELDRPYRPGDSVNPLGAYGRSKLAGEQALIGNHRAVIVRTSWLFGPRGKCFPKSILAAFDAGKTLRVVSDQFGSPTYTPALADRLVQTVEADPFPGTYHLAGPEITSWFEFASKLLSICRGSQAIQGIDTKDWPTAAVRPRYSALDSSELLHKGVALFPSLDDSLRDFCNRV